MMMGSDNEDSDEEMFKMYARGEVSEETLKTVKSVRRSVIEKKVFDTSSPKTAVVYSPNIPSPAVTSEKYGSRSKSGEVITRFKCKDSSPWEERKCSGVAPKIEALSPTSEFDSGAYKFMFQNIRDIETCIDNLHPPDSEEDETLTFRSIPNNEILDPLSVLIAAGPFCPNDSTLFEPLKDLLTVIRNDKPDVCIMMGPFIEATHFAIEQDGFSIPFEDIIKNELVLWEKELGECPTEIILVPNYRDINAEPVFPTPPYQFDKLSKTFVPLPDPAIVSIGGIVFGLTSTDILMHLSRSDALKNSTSEADMMVDKMTRATRHMLTYQNFYPMFPPDEFVPFDAGNFLQFGHMEVRPHILILPSQLNYFIKNIDETITINPGRITKGSTGGTYARLLIDLSTEKGNNDSDGITSVADYCVGEIIKI